MQRASNAEQRRRPGTSRREAILGMTKLEYRIPIMLPWTMQATLDLTPSHHCCRVGASVPPKQPSDRHRIQEPFMFAVYAKEGNLEKPTRRARRWRKA